MNVHRNVLKIVAGTLLIVSLPAGAQVLGGSVGGAANAAFGGALGRSGIDGAAGVGGNAALDASGAFGAARDRAQRTGDTTRGVAAGAFGAAHSRVESARGETDASVQTAHSAAVDTSRRAARAAARSESAVRQGSAAQTSVQPGSGLSLNGSTGASAQRHAAGRDIRAEGAADSYTRANRSGLTSSAGGQAGVSMQKHEPASPAADEAPAAK